MPTLDDYKEVLESLGANNFVVQDDESWSYSTNNEPGIVIRVYKDSSENKYQALEHKKKICSLLENSGFEFSVEKIYSIHFADGKLYSKEKRMFGVHLSQILDNDIGLSVKIYCSVAKALREFPIVELLPIFKWSDFIYSKINTSLSQNFELLKSNHAIVPYNVMLQLCTLIIKNLQPIENFGLMHGILTPANCLVDPADTNKVVAILNFGELTVIGDPRLESAGQLFFVENLEPAFAKKMSLGIIASMVVYGENIHTIINIYRIYWATMLLHDPRYQIWAFNVLRNCQSILEADHIWQPTIEPPLSLKGSSQRKSAMITVFSSRSSSLATHRITCRQGSDGEEDIIEKLSPSSVTVTKIQRSFFSSYTASESTISLKENLESIDEGDGNAEEEEDWFKENKPKSKSSSEKLGF